MRIVLGCFEVPGWGGLTTATYRLFELLLGDGLDVHYVNLVLEGELPRFRKILGEECENPRSLPNVHSCHLRGVLHDSHAELTSLIDELKPDRIVGVGDISAYLMKRANPDVELFFLTAGCMQVRRDIPFTEQLASTDWPQIRLAWKEREAVNTADAILTHSPMIRDAYARFYPAHADKIHPRVFWFAEWIASDAEQYLECARPFEDRDIDALFIASSWTRAEKNVSLVKEIVERLPGRAIHVVGEHTEAVPGAVHDGFASSRSGLFALMGRTRTVVCTSLFDAAPGILFEGSAMGCNVVASRNCGNWELCNSELLVDDYTADAFVAAIERGLVTKLADNMDRFVEPSSYEAFKRLLSDRSLSTHAAPGGQTAP